MSTKSAKKGYHPSEVQIPVCRKKSRRTVLSCLHNLYMFIYMHILWEKVNFVDVFTLKGTAFTTLL